MCRAGPEGPAAAGSGTRASVSAPPTRGTGPGTRTCPSPSGVVSTRPPGPPAGASRRADSPIRSSAPGAKWTWRVPTRVPSSVVPFVESRSATDTRPSAPTVTAQCNRETSGSSSGTSASAERPMRISPPCRRWTPPASGPATTWSWAGASSSSGCGSGSPGAPTDSTAPSVSGGSPSVHRWVSSRCSPAYSTGEPEPSPPWTTWASAEATAASAVPAGAVTSTSLRGARSRPGTVGPCGSTTVSRICIAVSGPFCSGAESPTPPQHVGQYCTHPRTCH